MFRNIHELNTPAQLRKTVETRKGHTIVSPADTPDVSVIIVNYNARDWLVRSVQSILDQSLQNFECFIVDNGSDDGSMSTLPDLDKRFHIIKSTENLGFSTANNLAAKETKAPWLALLNPDAFARPDWLEQLLNATKLAPNVTMVGSLQYMALDTTLLDGTGDCYHVSGLAWRSQHLKPADDIPPTGEVFAPCAAGALYDKTSFLKVGGFDEQFFCYHEDVDLAFRMRLDGGICVQSESAIIDHVSSGISGRASDFAVYHGTRNRVWTFVKNMPGPLLLIFTPALVFINTTFLVWAIVKRRARLAPTWRGIKDGIKGIPKMWGKRRAIHANRKIGSMDVLRSLTWSPLKVLRRDSDIRPIKNPKT